MSGYEYGNWHNANGGGLPYRPPTVDEALPYSPFTSVVPFSPDIIPFPTTEPPTPATTLSSEQQSAAKKAIGILNEEIKGAASTAQHLEHALLELRNLIGSPREMTEYRFKATMQLATPPLESTFYSQSVVAGPTKAPVLSPFATMLLRQTEVHYLPAGAQRIQRPKVKQEAPRQTASQPPVYTPSKPLLSVSNHAVHIQNGSSPYKPSPASSAASSSTPSRPGPAVVVKPLGPGARREEYQRYDNIAVGNKPDRTHEERQHQDVLSTMRPQEREIGEQKIHELNKLVQKLMQEKDDPDESEYFHKANSLEGEVTVMRSIAIDRLYDRVMVVCGHDCFSSVSVDIVLRIHSLCEPSITSTDQFGDLESWAEDLVKAVSGLKASKLVLTAMLQRHEDRRVSPEDLVLSVIQAVKNVLHSCIIPILGSRRTSELSDIFNYATAHKDQMLSLLRTCGSILNLLGKLIGKTTLTDTTLTPLEFLALELVVQPNSDSEKDSVFGIQKFESLRQAAMEVLTQIFANHSDHQLYIMTEILNNLEKLPDKGVNARQYKSARDPPIMSVSALFMRFVQVAATNQRRQNSKAISQVEKDDSAEEDDSDYEPQNSVKKDKLKGNTSARSLAHRLMEDARNIAVRIASALVDRALNVSKSGDKPFRNLLDMFVEDFCNVLGSPEWPAAVILLQRLLGRLHQVLGSGSNRDMALSMMATMGCGIIDFRLRIKHLKRDLDICQSELSAKLDQMVEEALNSNVHPKDLLSFKGPYRMVIESLPDYLRVQANQDDPHLVSVQGCYVTCWVDAVNQFLSAPSEDASRDQTMTELQTRLENMIIHPTWLSREYKFQNVSEVQSRLASGIVTLQDNFCRFLPSIVSIMVNHTRESAATLKSRAIKSIESFLNKDPQIIPAQAVQSIIQMFQDNSPLVRSDAISLISRCLEGDPALERQCLNSILRLTTDPSNGPKKKAINLLKKIYSGSASKEHKHSIVVHLLLPSQDHEKAIAELARQALEEVWLRRLDPDPHVRADENQLKLHRAQRASLLIDIVRRIQNSAPHVEAFEKFFANALRNSSNNRSANLQVCRELVADMIEGVISPESLSAGTPQGHVLQALSTFAKINPKLFTLDQVQLLKLYVKDLPSREDLATLRPTVTIFRFVFPHLPGLQAEFAQEVSQSLTKVISKLASWASQGSLGCKETLSDVIHCLWMIGPLTKEGLSRLIILVSSTVTQLHPMATLSKEEALKSKTRIISYLILLGTFGRTCSLDDQLSLLQRCVSSKAQEMVNRKQATQEQMRSLLGWAGSSGAALLLETVRPFTKQNFDMVIREPALCSLGDICQGSPALFMRPDVEATFKVVLKNDNAQLQRVALGQFTSFFERAERRSDGESEDRITDSPTEGARLGITFVAGDGQVTTNYLARRFLPDVVDIALKHDNEIAIMATNVITSISRQGLVHPKECGPALIALGTSPNIQIVQSATTEHKKIHDAHESMFEKEYMSAVRMAFDYQQSVCNDTHGMLAQSYKPKMLQVFNVLKGGSRKTLKKFIDNLCKQLDFQLPDLAEPQKSSSLVLFSRFCLENLALFDVPRLEDVAILLNALENIVLKSTGPSVGVVIETEMPMHAALPEHQPDQPQALTSEPAANIPEPRDTKPPVPKDRLLQITRACMILLMMWETRCFVRRAYNLHNLTGRIPQKDYQKPASRNNLVSGRELWERLETILTSTENLQTMMKRCYEFAELLEVDKDAKVDEEDVDGNEPAGYTTPVEGDDDGSSAVPTSGRGRKRKSSANVSNTPKKHRGRPPGSKGKKRNSKTPDLDEWD